MRAAFSLSGATRHAAIALAEGLIVAGIIAALLLALSPIYAPARLISGTDQTYAAKGGNNSGWIAVGVGAEGSTSSFTVDSHFVASGCGFRAGSSDYYLVIYGPAPGTASLGYWVDPFPVAADGCGSATPSWSSSGVDGTFDVYVVRSPSGNPWQAQPASNVVTITIVNP